MGELRTPHKTGQDSIKTAWDSSGVCTGQLRRVHRSAQESSWDSSGQARVVLPKMSRLSFELHWREQVILFHRCVLQILLVSFLG